MKNEYEHNGQKIIVDMIKDGEVYYRKFKGDEFVGAFRMMEDNFRSELERNKLEW